MTGLMIALLVSIVLLVLVVLLGVIRTGVRGRSVADRRRPVDAVVSGRPSSRHLAAAEHAHRRARRAIQRTRTNTLRDRRGHLLEQLDRATGMVLALTLHGEQLDRRIGSLGPASLRTRLATFHEQTQTDPSPDLDAAIAAVERQLETAERLRVQSNMTAIVLSRAVDRFERLATRAEESGPDDIDRLLAETDVLLDELEQAQASLDRTSRSDPDAGAGPTDR